MHYARRVHTRSRRRRRRRFHWTRRLHRFHRSLSTLSSSSSSVVFLVEDDPGAARAHQRRSPIASPGALPRRPTCPRRTSRDAQVMANRSPMHRSMMFQSRCTGSDAQVLGEQVTGAQVHDAPNRSRALLPGGDDMAEPELAKTKPETSP